MSEPHGRADAGEKTGASRRRGPLLVALALLLAVAVPAVFYNLSGGALEIYDEGLYGHKAQHMLTYKQYLYAVNEKGAFGGLPKFSKPPLSLWAVAGSHTLFGASMWSLRFPFALSTFLLVLACFAWGCRIGGEKLGPWLGLAWGISFSVCGATMIWGRRATIDAMLGAFVIAALLLHAMAIESRSRWTYAWTVGSGVCLAFGFMTKQLAVAYAAIPIVVFELVRIYYDGLLRVFLRLSIASLIPIGVGGAWFYLAYKELGQKLLDVMFDHSIATRISGFDGILHYRHLNRVADSVTEICAPFRWELGAIGLVLLVARVSRRSREARETPSGVWLLPGALLTLTLVLENVSSTTIAWYHFTFAPIFMAGIGWLVSSAFRYVWVWVKAEKAEPTLWEVVHVGLGTAVLLSAAVDACHESLSQVNLVVVAVVVPLIGLVVARGKPFVESKSLRYSLLSTLVFVSGALALGVARHREFREGPTRMSLMMGVVGQSGATRVSVDRSWHPKHYERTTYFGTHAKMSGQPWDPKTQDRKQYDARVELISIPNELRPVPGISATRGPGVAVFVGDILHPPFASNAIADILERGPVTFEAEFMGTSISGSLANDSAASGGRIRAVEPWLNELVPKKRLTVGPGPVFPKGEYVAVFFIDWGCDVAQNIRIGTVRAGASNAKERAIRCQNEKHEPDAPYQRVALPIELTRDGEIDIFVGYERGDLRHDKTEIWRRDKYREQK